MQLKREEKVRLGKAETALAVARRQLAEARSSLEKTIDEKLEKDAKQEAWGLFKKRLVSTLARKLEQQLEKRKTKNSEDPPSLEVLVKLFGFRAWFGNRISKTTVACLCFVLIFGIIGVVVHAVSTLPITGQILAFASPVLSAIGALAKQLYVGKTWVDEQRKNYETGIKASRDRLQDQRRQRIDDEISRQVEERAARKSSKQVPKTSVSDADNGTESPPDNVASREKRVRRLEGQVEAIQRNVGMTGAHTSLVAFLKERVDSKYYDEKLGLIHQVKKDLDELTEAMMSEQRNGPEQDGQEPPLFPRGSPRIVLIIDDLDRCPPQRVVEVLEAAQLLVKTRLFVLVLAMDVRYITRALEAAYPGVLVRDGEPSGLDYLEKIVQIPYRVPSIHEDAMEGFLRDLMDLPSEPEDVGKERSSTVPAEATPVDPEPGPTPPTPKPVGGTGAHTTGGSPSPRQPGPAVPDEALPMKIIWHRRPRTSEPTPDVKKAMALFLAMSARYPYVMRRLLQDLKEKLHAQESSAEKLNEFLVGRCDMGSKETARRAEWTRAKTLFEDKNILESTLTLEDLGLDNVQLIRSFSFLAETDAKRSTVTTSAALPGSFVLSANCPAPLS